MHRAIPEQKLVLLVMFLRVGMLGVETEKDSFLEDTAEHAQRGYIFTPSEEGKI